MSQHEPTCPRLRRPYFSQLKRQCAIVCMLCLFHEPPDLPRNNHVTEAAFSKDYSTDGGVGVWGQKLPQRPDASTGLQWRSTKIWRLFLRCFMTPCKSSLAKFQGCKASDAGHIWCASENMSASFGVICIVTFSSLTSNSTIRSALHSDLYTRSFLPLSAALWP